LAVMVRGSVVWVRLDPAQGAEVPKTRPSVVVSRTEANDISWTVSVVPLSSVRGRRLERLIQPIVSTKESRLPRDSRALCDQVRTIDKGRIQRTVGVMTSGALAKIDRGLILHLQLEDYVTI